MKSMGDSMAILVRLLYFFHGKSLTAQAELVYISNIATVPWLALVYQTRTVATLQVCRRPPHAAVRDVSQGWRPLWPRGRHLHDSGAQDQVGGSHPGDDRRQQWRRRGEQDRPPGQEDRVRQRGVPGAGRILLRMTSHQLCERQWYFWSHQKICFSPSPWLTKLLWRGSWRIVCVVKVGNTISAGSA